MTTFDPAAEKALALTCANDPGAWDYVGDLVEPEMLGDEQAQRVLEAVRQLVLRGRRVSPVAVQAVLQERGATGSALPSWNTPGDAVSREEARELAGRLRELWARRQIQAMAEQVARTASEAPSARSTEALGALLAAVQRGGGRSRSMAELSKAYQAELEADAARPQGERLAYVTGFPALDRHTGGLRPGVLAVLAGRPGQGKTSFVMAIAHNLAASGVPVGLFWLEDDWRDAVRRYYSRRSHIPSDTFRQGPARALERFRGAAAVAGEIEDRIHVDDAHGLTINDLAARMRRMAREKGVRVFFADHLGEIQVDRAQRWGDRHDLALGAAARIFRDTAKDVGAVPVLCSQMNRQVERRADSAPRLSDLDGSGQLEQAARVVAFVGREVERDGKETGRFLVDLQKNSTGRTGLVVLRWRAETMTVEDVE